MSPRSKKAAKAAKDPANMTEQQKDAVEVKKKEALARWSVSRVEKQKEKRAGQTDGEKDDANQKRRDAHAALTKEQKEVASRKRKGRYQSSL